MEKSVLNINMNKALVDYIKEFAKKNDKSISDVFSQLVLNLKNDTKSEIIGKREEFLEKSKTRALELLNEGFHMGGKIMCSRNELHER